MNCVFRAARFALLAAIGLGAASCSDDDSGATADASTTADAAVTDCSTAIELTNDDIAGGTTLAAGTCYLVNENLVLDDGIVTAEAGVVLQFATNRSFDIRSGGQLELAGTAAAPVRLTSQDPVATWKGVRLNDSQGSSNAWSYAVIDRAGDDEWTGADYSAAAVYLDGSTTLQMDNVSISNSESHGLIAFAEVEFSFSAGSFEGNETPAYLHPQVVSSIGADATFSANANDYIRVTFGNNDVVTGTHSWPAHRYRVEQRSQVEGDVTIAPGAVFEFAQDVSLIVESGATLTAVGTDSAPIEFRGAANTRGYWKGIEIESGGTGTPVTIGATFDHCTISDAGGQAWSGAAESLAAVYLQDTSAAKITNTTIRNSGRYGLWAGNNARLPEFGSNTFSGNARVMILHPDRVGELSGTSTISGNDDDGIYVVFGNNDRVSTDASWRDLGVPYVVRDRFYTEAALTIEAGVTVQFPQDQGLIVEEDGSLIANGTAAEPVVLEGQNDVATGYWQGLRIQSNNPNNKLTHTTVENAGANRWTGDGESDAAIFLDGNARISLDNTTLGPGGGYGVHLSDEGSVLGCSAVTFTSLVKGDVWVDDPSPGAAVTGCP
jgi:hypothetical protein